MIDRSIALAQIARCAGLEFFAALTESAMDELVTALSSAQAEETAADTVTEWLHRGSRRPTPAELCAILERKNREYMDRTQGHHADCFKCCDVGLVVVDGKFAACDCGTGYLPFTRGWIGREAEF